MSAPSAVRFSLVIPAYNEQERIPALFDHIGQFDGELIVVCDGNDRTPEIVEQIAAARPGLSIRCLQFSRRLGKGGGVIAGLKAARAPYVGYLDADGSTEISEMMRLFLQLGAYDGAIGSRWVGGATMEVRQGLMRRLESRAFNLIIRLLFGLDYRDTQCGAKVFKKSAIDAVLPQIISRGFEFDVELLWRLKRAGFTVGEFPVRWKNTGGSRVGRSDMVQMLAGLLNIRFGLRQP